MRPSIAAFLALAPMLAACGEPDPWAGIYLGTIDVQFTECAGGPPRTASFPGETVRLERDAGGQLFVNDVCLFVIDDYTTTSARYRPVGCDTTIEGVPVHFELVSGRAELADGRLVADLAYDVSGGVCYSASSTFRGDRVE